MNKRTILFNDYLLKHPKNERFTLALINLDDNIFAEKNEGIINLKKYGECKINCYGSEGTIPHFHIENKDLSFICCIRLDKPEYFNHGIKQGTLNNNQIKELIKVLNSKSKSGKYSVFEALCVGWNVDLSNKYKINHPFKIPDYTKLNKKEGE